MEGKGLGWVQGSVGGCQGWNTALQHNALSIRTDLQMHKIALYQSRTTHTYQPVQCKRGLNDEMKLTASLALNGLWTLVNAEINCFPSVAWMALTIENVKTHFYAWGLEDSRYLRNGHRAFISSIRSSLRHNTPLLFLVRFPNPLMMSTIFLVGHSWLVQIWTCPDSIVKGFSRQGEGAGRLHSVHS